jgi:hypothetical protein
MALSLPNVCVFPSSMLKFHKAYDWNTKVRDEGASAQLFTYYPEAVKAKLGGLTRDYHVLTGAELIALGVRDCNADQIQIARAKPSQVPAAAAPPAPASGSNLFGTILAALTPAPAQAPAAAPKAAFAPVRTAPAIPATAPSASAESVPLPPPRPADLDAIALVAVEVADVPLPPRRPPDVAPPIPGLPKLISGAQPTLPYGVLSYTAFGR